jgi:hypothetical protein
MFFSNKELTMKILKMLAIFLFSLAICGSAFGQDIFSQDEEWIGIPLRGRASMPYTPPVSKVSHNIAPEKTAYEHDNGLPAKEPAPDGSYKEYTYWDTGEVRSVSEYIPNGHESYPYNLLSRKYFYISGNVESYLYYGPGGQHPRVLNRSHELWEYLDEDFYGDNAGRVSRYTRYEKMINKTTVTTYEYWTGTDVVRYKHVHEKPSGITGNYTYYANGRLESADSGLGNRPILHYIDEDWQGQGHGRMDKYLYFHASGQVIAYEVEYHQGTDVVQFKKEYETGDFSDRSNPVLINLIKVSEYDIDGNLIGETLADGTVYEYDNGLLLVEVFASEVSLDSNVTTLLESRQAIMTEKTMIMNDPRFSPEAPSEANGVQDKIPDRTSERK